MMTAKKASDLTSRKVEALKEAETEKAREAERQREEHLRKLIQSIPEVYLPEIEKRIRAAIEKGKRSTVYEINVERSEFHSELVKTVRSYGYRVELKSQWHNADNGDPDSGEGRRDAGWDYWLDISW